MYDNACKYVIVQLFILMVKYIRTIKTEVVFTIKVGRCRIQELLDERKWTQQELANRTGMSKQYINDKIKGRGKHGMWIDSAKTIATALGCSVDDLYEWLPDDNSNQEDAD